MINGSKLLAEVKIMHFNLATLTRSSSNAIQEEQEIGGTKAAS